MERKDWKGQWDFKKLGEVCELYQPQTISKQQLDDSAPYPVYGANGIIGRYSQFNHKEKELLMTCRGATCGTINISEAYSWINGNAMVIHPKSNCISIYFLRYLFNASDLSSIITGAAQPQITRSTLSNFPIPVPPLPVQARIVDELDCLQGILSKKRQQLAEYHSLAQAIFHQMFGDPVVNEKGWEVKRLGEVCDSFNYGTSSAADENGKMKYLRMNNLTYEGEIILDNMKYINVDKESYEKYVVRRGDILFNRTNSKELVGKTALFNFDEEMIIAGYIIRIRVNNNTLHPQYATSYMNSPYMKAYLTTKAKGAVNQANISAKELKLFPIPLPPLPLQQSFAARIAAIDSQRERLAASIRELETLLACRMETLLNCPQA